jgi:hypothetical protein
MCGGASWAEDACQPSAALLRDLDAALSPLKREAEELSLLPGVPLS